MYLIKNHINLIVPTLVFIKVIELSTQPDFRYLNRYQCGVKSQSVFSGCMVVVKVLIQIIFRVYSQH